jgi:hypothetical protein
LLSTTLSSPTLEGLLRPPRLQAWSLRQPFRDGWLTPIWLAFVLLRSGFRVRLSKSLKHLIRFQLITYA